MPQFDADLYTEQNEKFKRAAGNTRFLKQVLYKLPIAAPTGVATADTIRLFELPVGAVVRPDLSSAYWSGTGATSVTVSLGDETDPNRYMVTEDISTGAVIPSLVHSSTIPAGVSSPYTVPEDTAAGVSDKTLLLTAVAVGTWTAASDAGYINLVVDLP